MACAAVRADTTSHALAGPPPALTEDTELILQIQTQHGEMADTITGYGLRQGVYLPLGAIARFLDLAIAVSDDGHYASGWFLTQRRTLVLNMREHKLTVEGRDVALGGGDAVPYQGELYVRSARFADLMPLGLVVNLREQTVTVKTCEPFPYEQRAAREAARDRVGAHPASQPEKHWPRENLPYSALSLPIGELESRAISDTALGTRIENDLRLAGDVGFMTGRIFLSTASNYGLTAARIELGRRDPDASLLGPLHASEFQMGDVSTVSLPMGLRSTTGRGAFVTNAPLSRVSVFDTIDLRGELPDGYDVELYRNDTLIGSTNTPVNGQYQFLAVPVDFGLNVFRLVFYGPQGQRREEVRQISVGDGRIPKGQFLYTAGLAQKDINLLNIKGPNYTPTVDDGAWRAIALMQYGISSAFTGSLGGAWFQAGGLDHWQSYAGLRTGLAGVAIKLDLGAQSGGGPNGGGTAAEIGLGGKFAGINYVLTHAEYGGNYIDEVRSPTSLPLIRADNLDLNTTLHFGSGSGAVYLPLSGHFDRLDFTNGQIQTDASLRGSLSVARFVVSNSFDYTGTANPGGATSQNLIGAFDLSSYSGRRTQFRAMLAYTMLPQLGISEAGVEVDRAIDDRTAIRGGVTYSITGHETTLTASTQHRFDRFTLSFDGSYGAPQRDYSFVLRMAFSFGRNPLTGKAFMARPGLSSSGAVVARAFHDVNGDGQFGPGDEPLAGVDFNTGSQHGTTDKQGETLIGAIGDGTRTNLRIDNATLPDIALAPASEGVELVPRAGRIQIANFAVVTLSDVEGTAYFVSTDKTAKSDRREVSGLILWLVDAKGKQVAHSRTEGDGYFLFEQLRPGDYSLRIDPKQAAALHIHLDREIPLHLDAKGSSPRVTVRVVTL